MRNVEQVVRSMVDEGMSFWGYVFYTYIHIYIYICLILLDDFFDTNNIFC